MSLNFTIRVSINKFHFIRDNNIVERQNREVQKTVLGSVMCPYHITKGLAVLGLLEFESLIGSLPLNHTDFISLKSLVIRPSKRIRKLYHILY